MFGRGGWTDDDCSEIMAPSNTEYNFSVQRCFALLVSHIIPNKRIQFRNTRREQWSEHCFCKSSLYMLDSRQN